MNTIFFGDSIFAYWTIAYYFTGLLINAGVAITGLPVPVRNVPLLTPPFSLVLAGLSGITGHAQAYADPGGTNVYLQHFDQAGALHNMTEANFRQSSTVMIEGRYPI